MYNGIVNVYKEPGWTSADVVSKLRGIFKQKKIGHAGTLDPDAEGVLPVCIGNATKASDMLKDHKTYTTVMLLGVDTDTQDISGKVLREGSTDGITEDDIRNTVASFKGEIMQMPPMYSARKVNGKRLYSLARKGENVERNPGYVNIDKITVDEIAMPRVKMTVSCSKGTYIRTLCRDIGSKLKCYGTMESLIRTESSGFLIGDALRITEIQKLKDEDRLDECVQPLDTVFSDYPKVSTKESADCLLYNGNRLFEEHVRGSVPDKPEIRMTDSQGVFCGIYRWDDKIGALVPVKMFLPE